MLGESKKRSRERMPDQSHQRDRDNLLEGYAPVNRGSLGPGVLQARNKKSFIVNIRPQRWNDKFKPSQFWKGRIKTLGLAKYYADAIFYYCGKPRCHFGNAPFTFPHLRTVRLSTPAQRSSYVQGIAGIDFCVQREEFIGEVMEVVESADFFQQGERFLRMEADNAPPADEDAPDDAPPADEDAPANAPPADEVAPVSLPPADEFAPLSFAPTDEGAADSTSPGDEAGRDEECETPFEEDSDDVAKVVRLGSVAQGASVLTFELDTRSISDARRTLKSVPQRLGSGCFSIYDCPSDDDKDWNTAINELDEKSAMAKPQLQPAAGNVTAPVGQ